MKLQSILGYSSAKGTQAWTNFTRMMEKRLARWTKHDAEARARVWACSYEADYDWAADSLKVRVMYRGDHVFTLTDPDDQEQMQALAVTIQMLE